MRKILLISFYFSPCTLTPSQRITYWAKQFHRLGFYPIVVTRAWSEDLRTHLETKLPLGQQVEIKKFSTHEVHYLPFKPGMLDRAYRNFGEGVFRPFFLFIKLLDVFLAHFTLFFTSYANFFPYLKKLTRMEQPEKVLISGEPFYLFKLGYDLFHSVGVSWIADYRDDWSTNELQMEKAGKGIRKWVAKVESRLEKKWVGTADFIISVSDAYTKRISDFLNKPGITIQNGFEESLLDRPVVSPFEVFTVMYSGVLYPSQDISMILDVLDRCHKKAEPFRLVFLGAGFDVKEKKRIEALIPVHLRDLVEVTERYPRENALEMLQRAHVLLGIAYGNIKGIPSSKLYEYLALGKPVLLCPTDRDVMEHILAESGLGFFAENPDQAEKIIFDLKNRYTHSGYPLLLKAESAEKVGKFSRFQQLKKLASPLGS